MSPTVGDISMSCLCCRFFTNENLFLPNQLSSPFTTQQQGTLADPDAKASTVTIPDTNEREDDSATPSNDTILQIGVADSGFDVSHVTIDPFVVWEQIRHAPSTSEILLIDTHTHAHLERYELSIENASNHIYSLSAASNSQQHEYSGDDDSRHLVLLSCAVDVNDWDRCLEYAAKSKYRIPALGVHPWYVESVLASSSDNEKRETDYSTANSTTWLDKLETLLQLHPGCMVGEIGLCKVARFIRTYNGGKQAALLIQRQIFLQQLLLAAKYRRPVSIHCVNQHGILLDVFNSLQHCDDDNNQIPPAMALHSYTGTAHHVQTLMEWETQVRAFQTSSMSTEPLLYFGFSHSVNYLMCTSTKAKRQGMETLRCIPRNRILIESDVHSSDHVALGAAGTIAYIAHVRNESIEHVVEYTTQNGLRFLSTLTWLKQS